LNPGQSGEKHEGSISFILQKFVFMKIIDLFKDLETSSLSRRASQRLSMD
jgi:hypothetical protein